MKKMGALVALFLVLKTTSAGDTCSNGISCITVPANGLIFQCRVSGEASSPPVLLLHGFPEWSAMYAGLQRELSASGYYSVACNQRGYSPGARPEGLENYHYAKLASDVFAVSKSLNISSFHLVGHDHGAALGWYIAASEQGKASLLSYTALSVPHLDAFSKGLWGSSADHAQVVASQYFRIFVLPDSASLNLNGLFNTMGRFNKDEDAGASFGSAAEFQKALFWYNGAGGTVDSRPAGAGVMALPAKMTATQLFREGQYAMAAFVGLYGGEADDGIKNEHPIGIIESIPSLFICGSDDSALLCTRPYSLATKDYIKGDYNYVEAVCGRLPLIRLRLPTAYPLFDLFRPARPRLCCCGRQATTCSRAPIPKRRRRSYRRSWHTSAPPARHHLP